VIKIEFIKINIRIISGFVFIPCFLLTFAILPRFAVASTEAVDSGITTAAQAAVFSSNKAAEAGIKGELVFCLSKVGISSGGVIPISAWQEAQMKQCMADYEAGDRALLENTLWSQVKAGDIKKTTSEALREALAISFKTSLKTFARQVAHDTAVWVASGGKGQKPLFITEGWGTYVKNAGDAALGDFIDGVGSRYGMDLCQPNFQVKLAIRAGLDYTQPRRTRCSFSQISTNWQSAINNASFSLDYKDALRPGENDISYALIMADQRNSYVTNATQNAAKDAEIPGLWKDIKNIAGQILTPGTVIANTFRDEQAKADIGFATFTNTVADIVEEFLNTLVSQLLKNLQSGLFSGSGGNNNNRSGFSPDLSGLAGLFNPNSSPIVSGIAGAKLAYSNLIEGQTKVGGNIDILLKLSTCSDAAKANPGPTDCVLDSLFASAIKEKKYVTDLDPSIKNRLFAPQINQKASVETTISARSIMIMRKYRIIPVGWEFAAEVIKKSTSYNNLTLNDVMNCFYGEGHNNCNTNDFKGLVDPYWVLKVPETFCRRVGYTGFNSFAREQNSGIIREQGCVDEQQCLQEDGQGNCKSYGYCTQERRAWDIGKICETKYNTCSTFKSRTGATSNWLANSLDFENCSAQTAGCRSYATNFNYQSKLWNGDSISALDGKLTRYSEFLDSSLVDVTLDPGWRVAEGHTVSANRRLTLGSNCNKANCDSIAGCNWNSTGNYCAMKAGEGAAGTSCLVPAGGISCYVDNCYTSESSLIALNPNFELQETGPNPGNAKFWTDELSYNSQNNRHYRAVGEGLAGYGLKAVSANNPADLITTLPNIPLEAGASHKLKFAIRGTISQGSIIVAMVAGDSPYNVPSSLVALGGQAFVTNVGSWTEVEMPIINDGNFTTGTIAIITPLGSITNVTLDNFELNKLKSECSAAGVKLFAAPTEPTLTQPSNIYFDRDVQTCSANAFGCSQFIRTKADLGNNLLYNGSLEYGLSGWATAIVSNPAIDQGAAVFNSGSSVDTYIEVEPNNYYAFGYDAARNSAAPNNAIATLTTYNTVTPPNISSKILETNCVTSSLYTAKLDNQPAGQYFERKSCYFKTPSDAHYIKLNVKAAADTIKVDNLKLEKVSYPNFSATAYSAYDPSTGHTGDQIAYIKQAPDYFSCYKNEGGAWPTTVFELNNIIAKRAPECSNFADVCMQSEVGCESYKPINGDPEIPGIVDGLDLCPGECSGYQVYQQEATNFIASSTFKQFIADKNAKYCSAAYAGCDEFTNLDEIGRGAEKKEYYVNFKTCQRPSPDDASYFTWEGSDITGYQLKAFTLKKSQILDPENISTVNNGYAPCTNLLYDALGKNYCNDPSAVHTNVNNADNYNSRYEFGICTKDDMPANYDCRELYDVDGNVHYRLLSKTVTVSDNCHPYRRTQTQLTSAIAESDCNNTSGWWKTSLPGTDNAAGECIYMAIPSEGRTCSAEVSGCRAYTGNRGNNVRNILSASNFTSATTSDNLWVDNAGEKNGIMISSEATYPGGNSLTTQNGNTIIKHQVRLIKNRTYTLSFWAKADASFNPTSIALNNNCQKNIAGADTCFTSDNSSGFAAVKLAGENPLNPPVLITTDWKRYDLGPVFITWEPGESDYLIFNLPSNAKIYLDNIILKELSNNIYAIENSWFTPVSCDNKLDDSDGKKAIASGDCQDESTSRCSVGEMLGCTAYKDRASAVWYLRSFNSLCRRQAVGCEALLATHNSESALAENFNTQTAPNYDDVTVPTDNLVYLVNDGKHSCTADNKGCNAFGLPLVDKWDAITGYQTVFLKNNPTRYSTDLCQHNALWCEEYATSNSLSYFKDPHGKTCDYVNVPGKATGWFKTGTNDPCTPDSIGGGSGSMSFGTGYEPVSEKVQPLGPYNDITNGSSIYAPKNRDSNYNGFAGNCPITSSGCSEYVDPDPSIYTNYLAPKDLNALEVVLKKMPAYVLYNLTGLTMTTNLPCQIRRPFGATSTMYYLEGSPSTSECNVTVKPADKFGVEILGGQINSDSKISKAGVYYSLSGSVNNSSCNGNVDFKSGCILMNARNSIDYNKTSIPDRSIKYLVYDSALTYSLNKSDAESKPVSPQMPSGNWQADSNLIVKAGANRTCEKWLDCTTYQKTGDSTQDYRFDNQDQCLNFGICNFRNADGSCLRYETAGDQDVNTSTTAFPNNMTGYTIPNNLPVASMDQFGSSASVPNGNFESVVGGTSEPLGWVMNASSSELNNDGWKTYKYAAEGKAQYLRFDSAYLAINSVYAVTSEPIDVQKGLYALDLWVNTQDIKPETARARIFITSEKMNGAKMSDGTSANFNNVYLPKDTGVKYVIMDGQNWLTSNNLSATSGLPWLEKTVLVNTTEKDTLTIKLMNFDDETALSPKLPDSPNSKTDPLNLDAAIGLNYTKCYDLQNKVGGGKLPGKPDFTTPCNLTGATLFDNVSLKSVLRIINYKGAILNSDNLPSPSELIARSCRAYPAQDARSCQYNANGNFYYGWYGYCLMNDPDNPGQCLQWYPVDQLKGDVVDEFSGGYSDQAPLYYCADVGSKVVTASMSGQTGGISGSLADIAGDVLGKFATVLGTMSGDASGTTGKTTPFTLSNPETNRLFRYPIVQEITAGGFAAGGGMMHKRFGFGFGKIAGILTKQSDSSSQFNVNNIFQDFLDTENENLGTGSILNLFLKSIAGPVGEINTDPIEGTNPPTAKMTDLLAINNNTLVGPIIDGIRGLLPSGNEVKNLNEWTGTITFFPIAVNIPDTPIFVSLGIPRLPWEFLRLGDAVGGASNAAGVLSTAFNAALTKLLSTTWMFAFDGTAAGIKVVNDADTTYASKFTDPNPNISGDILGTVWGISYGGAAGLAFVRVRADAEYPVYYCKTLVKVVTATSQNKAWVNRVSKASQFTFLPEDKIGGEGFNPYGISSDSANPDLNTANLGYQVDGYNADYKPFGSLVPPSVDSQNPILWSSSEFDPSAAGNARYPLFWEPPTLSGGAPYQARMGQPESPKGLSNLFAKSYTAWTWLPTNEDNPTSGGAYKPLKQKENADVYNNFIWDVPKDTCDIIDPTWNTAITGGYAIYKDKGYVRDMNDRDHFCLIKPEIITMSVNGSIVDLKDNTLSGGKDESLGSSRPAKLDFTVRIDRDQLPLTSYLIEWGDGNINNTAVTGVKLRARALPENPFTLYHMYDLQKVKDAAKDVNGDDCTNFGQSGCELHYCDTDTGECFVKINVTVTDNWRAEKSERTGFVITVK